jgi:hypothetical protein
MSRWFRPGKCYACGGAARYRCNACEVVFCTRFGCPLRLAFHFGAVPL